MENQETQPQDKTNKIYGGIEDALEVETSLVSDITKDKSSDLAEPVESTPIQKQILKLFMANSVRYSPQMYLTI